LSKRHVFWIGQSELTTKAEQMAGVGETKGIRQRAALGPTARRSPSIKTRYNSTPRSRQKDTVVIIEHFASDAYGLLILAPEIALGSGWLGGDRVVGRAAIRDLLKKAGRFTEDERQRLTIYSPSTALTLRLDEVERYYGA
jgi:hypothetical protein